jgi:hypothetical protein
MLDIQGVRPTQSTQINDVDWIAQWVDDATVSLPRENRYSASLDAHIVSAVQDAARIQQLNVNWRVINMNKKSIIQQVLSREDKPIELGSVS